MSIRELHPLRRKPVDVRRGDLALRIEALRIAIAEIIRQDDDDIRMLRGVCTEREQDYKDNAELLEHDRLIRCIHASLPAIESGSGALVSAARGDGSTRGTKPGAQAKKPRRSFACASRFRSTDGKATTLLRRHQ